MSIVVLGTVALDDVATPLARRKEMLGGSAAHFAMSARLFSAVNLVAVIGEDFPVKYINFLRRKSLNLASLVRAKGKTFRWKGKYQGDLNNALTLATELGVLVNFKPHILKEQKRIKNIFLANVDPDIQMHLLRQIHSPWLVGLDSMNYWINHKKRALLRILKKVDIYLANDQEAKILSGEDDLLSAARALYRLGPKMVLIKKGEHGLLFYSDKFIFSLPAYSVKKIVDPTGAGDTFAGGFMGYLSKAKKIDVASIKRALVYGTVAASFNVEGFGLERTARLTMKDLKQRLKKFQSYF
jgi:sugar/nucleoside kinase (ribokinase family)